MSGSGVERRPTQTQRIVDLLRCRAPQWVPLPEILALGISQYSARIHQARHESDLNIENRVELVNGEKHSFFRLVETSRKPVKAETVTAERTSAAASLFGNIRPDRSYAE